MLRRLLALLLVTAVGAACSSSSHGYGNATEVAFMETCTHREAQPEAICKCMYDEIAAQISFDRYVELDKEMQKDDRVVPDELTAIAADCAARVDNSNGSSSS